MTLDQDEIARALPGYDIGGELGRGGWGVVLEGRHRQLGRDVAIKQLPKGIATDSSVLERFVAEARALASLDHPHVVPIYDYVERDGLCLLVMEKLPGGTVWARFTKDGLTSTTVCAIVLATCAGLQAAHERRILHRDVKPENLMFSATGTLKVTDFGIAKVVGGEETLATRAGEVVGTPDYIAPEQARGGVLSPATDVYAVATMLYELLAGVLPFPDQADAMVVMFKHAFEQPVPLRQAAPSIPGPIADVVMSGLATEPSARPQTAEAFAVGLAEACTAVWGPGWLASETVPVMGARAILAATERVSQQPMAPVVTSTPSRAAPPTVARDAVAAPPAGSAAPATTVSPGQGGPPPGPGAPSTTVSPAVGGPPAGGAAPPTIAAGGVPAAPTPPSGTPVIPPSAESSTADLQPVKPANAVHTHGAVLQELEADDLVPVSRIVQPPAQPVAAVLTAIALLVVAVAVAVVGVGNPVRTGNLPQGAVTVAGADPSAGKTIKVDLSKPVAVGIGSTAPHADRVRLSLLVLGSKMVSEEGAVGPGPTTTLDLSHGRYLVPGLMTGEVDLIAAGKVVGQRHFAARTKQLSVLTAPGVVAIALVLLAVSYAEAFFRSLRRRRRRVTSSIGLAVAGGLLGVLAVVASWLAAIVEPTTTAVVVCAALGVAAGLAGGAAGRRIGERRRYQRRKRPRAATA